MRGNQVYQFFLRVLSQKKFSALSFFSCESLLPLCFFSIILVVDSLLKVAEKSKLFIEKPTSISPFISSDTHDLGKRRFCQKDD